MASNTLASAIHIAQKDLAIEFRTRSAFFSALVFSILASTVFHFAWDQAPLADPGALAPGVIWAIFVFSGILGLQRSFSVELADRALDGLLSSPVSRVAIFIGKSAANALFILGVQCIAVPAVILFFNVDVGGWILPFAGIVLLATLAMASLGTLFSSMAANTRLAELLVPMLALPFFIPVVAMASAATELLIQGRPFSELASPLRVLVAFDLVFVTMSAVLFPHTLED